MTDSGTRIAMWSGPRNISTAMMRAWENRTDTIVCDEPLYAHYLQQTGANHPGADQIISTYETDWRKVVAWLTGEIKGNASVFYQKHMAHHLLPNMDEQWLDQLTNCFLIREPREMLTSLIKFIPNPTIEDTGLPQQVHIYRRVAGSSDVKPPVLDARQILDDPKRALAMLCDSTHVEFDASMLSWPAGTRSTDGIWEQYWYKKIATTSSFCKYKSKDEAVPKHLAPLLAECNKLYDWLYQRRLK